MMEFILKNCLQGSQHDFPKSLVNYNVSFAEDPCEDQLRLVCAGQPVPMQLSDRVYENGCLCSATVSFITDLQNSKQKVFSLGAGQTTPGTPIAEQSGNLLTLKNSNLSVQIDSRTDVLFTVSQGDVRGSAVLSGVCSKQVQLLENGPVFAKARITATFENGDTYVQVLQLTACDEYVLLDETMEMAQSREMDIVWEGLAPTHRVDRRHIIGTLRKRYGHWLSADAYTDDDGLIRHIRLSPYDESSGRSGTHFMSFYGQELAAGVFCTDSHRWNDGTYSIDGYNYINLPQFYCKYVDGACHLRFHYPLNTGTRQTALTLYRSEKEHDPQILACYEHSYIERLYYFATRVPLNTFKDWVLEWPIDQSSFPRFFDPVKVDPEKRYGLVSRDGTGLPTPEQFLDHVTTNILNTQPWKSGACFTRAYEHWIPVFDMLVPQMTPEQFKQMCTILAFGAYICATEEELPVDTMLAGHPNFALDVKNCVGMCAALFPEHPHALRWKDQYEKAVALLLKYHVRPEVKTWEALAGRYTESYGTYCWGSMKHASEASLLLTMQYDDNPVLYPQLETFGNWILNLVTPPLGGRRSIPYSGAHAGCHEQNPFYPLWNVRALGLALRNYNPELSQNLLAICPPEPAIGHEDFSCGKDEDVWSHCMFQLPDAREPGTAPVLKSTKFTGYGFNLRANVGKPDEIHVFLQQIDEGMNYRWGRAAWGGCGNLHYYADGQRFSGCRKEDIGDDNFGDDQVGSNFCVLLDHTYKSIGQNDLIHPLVNLDFVQYARADAGSYSNAEYRYRSVMLVDNRYIVIYDAVRDEYTQGRFTWNSFVDEPMPYIHQLVPGVKPREVEGPKFTIDGTPRYPAVRQDKDVRGVIYDGLGDFLTVVSHRESVSAQATPFGAVVCDGDTTDYIFSNNAYGKYTHDDAVFAGKVGFARKTPDTAELALIDGQYVGIGGCKLTRLSGKGAVSVRMSGGSIIGQVSGGDVTVKLEAVLPDGCKAYSNGASCAFENGVLTLSAGTFQITNTLPVPGQVTGLSYVNTPEGLQLHFAEVPFAEGYEISVSKDGSTSWMTSDTNTVLIPDAEGKLTIQVRAVNEAHTGVWSDPMAAFVLHTVPRHVDGLRVFAKKGGYQIVWGRMAGASSYKLYRSDANGTMQCIWEGSDTRYFDPQADESTVYQVSCLNGYGESKLSLPRDTRPDGPAHFDPMPETNYVRDTIVNLHGYGGFDYAYNENRRILTYPE